MHARQRGRHAAVAFVGDDHRRTGFGHHKIRPGDAHVGAQEMAAQLFACLARQRGGIGLAGQPVFLRKKVGDLLAPFVNDRRDDV